MLTFVDARIHICRSTRSRCHRFCGASSASVSTPSLCASERFFPSCASCRFQRPMTSLCVDPLTNQTMDSFWQALNRSTWVLHSARQDIEVISQTARHHAGVHIRHAGRCRIARHGAANWLRGTDQGAVRRRDCQVAHTRAIGPNDRCPMRYCCSTRRRTLSTCCLRMTRLRNDWSARIAWNGRFRILLCCWTRRSMTSIRATRSAASRAAATLRGRRRAAAARLASWRESEALKRDRPRQWISAGRHS